MDHGKYMRPSSSMHAPPGPFLVNRAATPSHSSAGPHHRSTKTPSRMKAISEQRTSPSTPKEQQEIKDDTLGHELSLKHGSSSNSHSKSKSGNTKVEFVEVTQMEDESNGKIEVEEEEGEGMKGEEEEEEELGTCQIGEKHLCKMQDLPEWYSMQKFVLSGYRMHYGGCDAFLSIFQRHNEV